MPKLDLRRLFADNLRAACAKKFEREISQSELHRASGVSQKTISNIFAALREDGTEIANPSLGTIEALATTVNVDAWQLLHPDAKSVPILSDDEKELLRVFQSVPPDARAHILRTARLEASAYDHK